jgi:hypothetical protein
VTPGLPGPWKAREPPSVWVRGTARLLQQPAQRVKVRAEWLPTATEAGIYGTPDLELAGREDGAGECLRRKAGFLERQATGTE